MASWGDDWQSWQGWHAPSAPAAFGGKGSGPVPAGPIQSGAADDTASADAASMWWSGWGEAYGESGGGSSTSTAPRGGEEGPTPPGKVRPLAAPVVAREEGEGTAWTAPMGASSSGEDGAEGWGVAYSADESASSWAGASSEQVTAAQVAQAAAWHQQQQQQQRQLEQQIRVPPQPPRTWPPGGGGYENHNVVLAGSLLDPHKLMQGDADKRMYGTIKRYFGDKSTGYGFIDCPESRQRYGYDVYIHARQMHKCEVGDHVSFSIVRNAKGEPQARNVCKVDDEDKFLAKLQRDQEKQQSALQQKRQHLSYDAVAPAGGGGVLMTEEQAKRFQKSLKRS